MATKHERVEAIKEQLKDPRILRDAQDLAREMEILARSGQCDLPAGTQYEYHQAIFAAVDEGYLELVRGTHVKRVVPKELAHDSKRPATKPIEVKQDATPVQGMLF